MQSALNVFDINWAQQSCPKSSSTYFIQIELNAFDALDSTVIAQIGLTSFESKWTTTRLDSHYAQLRLNLGTTIWTPAHGGPRGGSTGGLEQERDQQRDWRTAYAQRYDCALGCEGASASGCACGFGSLFSAFALLRCRRHRLQELTPTVGVNCWDNVPSPYYVILITLDPGPEGLIS